MTLQEQYHQDIDYLVRTLENMHPDLYRNISKEKFDNEVAKIKEQKLNDTNFELEVMKLLSKINDPHTNIDIKVSPKPYKFKFLDGKLYIIDDFINQNSPYLYNEITAINGHNINDWVNEISKYVSYDNKSGFNKEVTELLSNSSFLQKISNSNNLIFDCKDGEQIKSFDLAEDCKKEIIKNEEKLKTTSLDNDTLYIKYGTCINNEENNIPEFITKTMMELDDKNPSKVIMDLRENTGGNSAYIKPLIERLKEIPTKTTIVDNKTFSSAVLAMQDMRNIGSIIVGEEPSLTQNHFGDCKNIILPNTNVSVWCSTAEFIMNNGKLVKITNEEKLGDKVKVTAYGSQQAILPKESITKREDFNLDARINPSINEYKKLKDPELIKTKLLTDSVSVIKQVNNEQSQSVSISNNNKVLKKTTPKNNNNANDNSSSESNLSKNGFINITSIVAIVSFILGLGVGIAYILLKIH